MNKLIPFAVAAFVAAASVSALSQTGDGASAQETPKKMMLKVSTVDTSGSRHQSTWVPPAKPLELTQKPYSEAMIMQASTDEAGRMRAKNEAADAAQRIANAKIAYENWKAADAHMKGIQAQLEGNAYGRQIILALDKFAGSAGTYFDPDCIEFCHRLDTSEADKEQALQMISDPEIMAVPYFIKLVFDDPREETKVIQLDSIQQVQISKYTQAVTYEVQDLRGKIVAAGNVKRDKQVRSSNAVQTSGTTGGALVDLLDEVLEDVAKSINDKFVAKISITLLGPKGDDAFYPEAATITFDGEERQAGEEFSVLKGNHVLDVSMDGYKLPGCPKKLSVTGSQNYKFVMVSSLCDLTVSVKGPADAEGFDADAATITLSGDEEFSLFNGESMQVPQGKYTLTVEVDGFQPVTRPVSLATPKQNMVIPVK